MFALLPLVSLIVLYGIFNQRSSCWRSSVLSAAIVWGFLLTVITEILSFGKLLTFFWLVGVWVLIDIILIYIYFQLVRKKKPIANRKTTLNLSSFSILLLCGVAFIIASVGLVALIAPPNNWDSMSYHMARVVHWIQNHSVAYYPTNYTAQLFLSPWSEFAIMHLQILSGGDRLANLVQWFSMVGSILGVSLIAKQIGADLHGQVFSAVVCATIPMGILQGSSTQNDYVVSFWLVCFVYYVLLTLNRSRNETNLFKISASLGLAILTKTTAYIYAFPFLFCFFILNIKKLGWKIWKIVVIMGFLVLVINIGFYARNLDLFHSPLATNPKLTNFDYTNDVFSLPILLSNIIRNISLHIGIPSWKHTFLSSVRDVIEGDIRILHTVLGVDINDPRTTWVGFSLPSSPTLLHEDGAANFIHLLLIVLTIILCLTWKRLRRQKYLVVYGALVVSAFLLFCLLLKWTPYNSRLHLPLFVLLSPFIGVVLSNLPQHKLVNSIAIILILSSLPWLFFNQSRPLISLLLTLKDGRIENIFNTSRTNQYFNNQVELREPYIGATNFLKSQKCSKVGLSIRADDWEYPFWVLLEKDNTQEIHIEHINVKNISSVKSREYPYKNFIPCAIISIKPQNNQEKTGEEIVTQQGTYVQEWSAKPVSVFMAR